MRRQYVQCFTVDAAKFRHSGLIEAEFNFGDFGPVAHLVERFHGMEEAVGSIPIRST